MMVFIVNQTSSLKSLSLISSSRRTRQSLVLEICRTLEIFQNIITK